MFKKTTRFSVQTFVFFSMDQRPQDLDIQVKSLAITEVLNPWGNNVSATAEIPTTRHLAEKKPTTKFRVMDLLYRCGKDEIER